jgi:hypothetical protein
LGCGVFGGDRRFESLVFIGATYYSIPLPLWVKVWVRVFLSVANATIGFNRVLAPEGEFLSFASPKERNQRKGDPDAAYFLRSSVLTGVAPKGHKPEGTSCPSGNVRHPCRTPNGLFPPKPPVLGAA